MAHRGSPGAGKRGCFRNNSGYGDSYCHSRTANAYVDAYLDSLTLSHHHTPTHVDADPQTHSTAYSHAPPHPHPYRNAHPLADPYSHANPYTIAHTDSPIVRKFDL